MKVNDYLGNCTNSFDDDCECIVDSLPWNDATDFAQALDDAEVVKPFEYPKYVVIPNPTAYFRTQDGVYIIYDDNDDIHYFFAE